MIGRLGLKQEHVLLGSPQATFGSSRDQVGACSGDAPGQSSPRRLRATDNGVVSGRIGAPSVAQSDPAGLGLPSTGSLFGLRASNAVSSTYGRQP